MEGHIRAGVALYEAGDLEAAKTHMGHPIKEKYGAVAGQLEELGMSDVRADLTALADAAEAEADYETVSALFAQVYARFEEARTHYTTAEQAAGLVALTRVAGEEYTVAVKGDGISNLHEYQDSWGFIRAVETEAIQMAASNNETVAEVGAAIRAQVNAMDGVYGDLQGQGDFEITPSTIYSAAARMEIAALDLDSNGAN
ncbi:hypothetical protein FPL09_09135 [Spiribacter vilamensis]|nr:hypothetical protein FPL09_09135 [Spiribacter vilamensis]